MHSSMMKFEFFFLKRILFWKIRLITTSPRCVNLNEVALITPHVWMLDTFWWNCLDMTRRYNFLTEVYQSMNYEIKRKKKLAALSCSLSASCWIKICTLKYFWAYSTSEITWNDEPKWRHPFVTYATYYSNRNNE